MSDTLLDLPSGGELGLDIETITPDHDPDDPLNFEDSEAFELLATAIAYRPPNQQATESDILWRDGLGPAAEAAHLDAVADLIDTLAPARIVTFNGERFDFAHLLGRADLLAKTTGQEDLPRSMRAALGAPEHLDLQPAAWKRYGRYTSLEELAERQGLPVRRTRLSAFDHGHPLDYRPADAPAYVVGADLPPLGEALLRARDGEPAPLDPDATQRMLTDYALGDVDHLLTLADRHPFEG